MSKARDLADSYTDSEIDSDVIDAKAGRKNLIINGGFDVSQRGNYSSATATANNAYSLDRWSLALSLVTGTVQHNEVVLPNGTKTMAMKVAGTSTSASTGFLGIRQVIEDFRILSGQVVTASMWIRTNLESMTFRHDSTTNFGDYVTPDGEWHYHTATYQMPTITSAGRSANQTTLAIINYTGLAGGGVTAGDYFEVANVQLELGSQATDFEYRSYGEELALCKRYYEIAINGAKFENTFGLLKGASTTQAIGVYYFDVEKRAKPTITTSGIPVVYIGGSGYVPDSVTSTNAGTLGGRFIVNDTVYTASQAYHIDINTFSLAADAEL